MNSPETCATSGFRIKLPFRNDCSPCHKRLDEFVGNVNPPLLFTALQTGKLISQVEIPAFIPRQDLLEQLTRWALSNAQDDGLANFG